MKSKQLIFDNRPPQIDSEVHNAFLEGAQWELDYRLGRISEEKYQHRISKCLIQVSQLLELPTPNGLIITSSIEEAVNTAIKGFILVSDVKNIVNLVGDPQMFYSARHWAESMGITSSVVPLLPDGDLDWEYLNSLLSNEKQLVALGISTPEVHFARQVDRLFERVNRFKSNIVMDITKAMYLGIGCDKQRMASFTIDLMQFGAPAGTAICWLNPLHNWTPLIGGGIQQSGFRGGELSPALLLSALKSLQNSSQSVKKRLLHFSELHKNAKISVKQYIPEATIVSSDKYLPLGITIMLPDVEGEAIVLLSKHKGLLISSSSNCYTMIGKPSPVLIAMGFSKEVISGSIHLTYRDEHSVSDVETAIRILNDVYRQLRKIS